MVRMSTAFKPTRTRFTVEQFHEMGRAGILSADCRVELIEGELIDMAPIGSLHASVVAALSTLFARQVGDEVVVWTQNPISLPPEDEPLPDIALLRQSSDRYRGSLPVANDVLLLIEVADTTLQHDRATKLALYARHGVREVWIVNLVDRVVEVYREPSNSAYRVKLERNAADVVAPVALPTVEVGLAEILS